MPATKSHRRSIRPETPPTSGPKPPAASAALLAPGIPQEATGRNAVWPDPDSAEIERRFAAFRQELQPSGELGALLARRAALLSVRLDRSAAYEAASLSRRVRQAESDFVAPEGADAASVERLKAEARALALHDPSREATLARRHEAATERSFFRILKEIRQLAKPAAPAQKTALDLASFRDELASFLDLEAEGDELEAQYLEPHERTPFNVNHYLAKAGLMDVNGKLVDVPITVGQRR